MNLGTHACPIGVNLLFTHDPYGLLGSKCSSGTVSKCLVSLLPFPDLFEACSIPSIAPSHVNCI
jgi:hypothetical protein